MLQKAPFLFSFLLIRERLYAAQTFKTIYEAATFVDPLRISGSDVGKSESDLVFM